MSENIDRLITSISAELIRRGEMICAAESCTGGLIAKSFTDLAGSSAWFERGFVTYSNQAKIDMLGVDPQTLLEHGAVSEQTVGEMVKGAQLHSRAQVAVAVTGIAGPDGGSEDKPVGTVWFGFALGDRRLTIKQRFDGDRAQVRQASLQFALEQIELLLKGDY